MKVSYNWLKDLVPFDHKPEELAEVLTLAGFEIDAIDAITLDYAGLVVGEVLERIKHPDADKLSVCTVSVGGAEPLQIVCGAPNVAKGQKVPVATVGTELPGGFNIRKAKIRGQHSFGMICSEAELGLSDNADGIWVLPGTVTVGEPVAKALGFETDYVLDVSITPNRPDALSHYGIAREIAAITGNALNNPEIRVPESAEKAADHIKVTIETPAGCPRYAARLIRGISRGSSPDWMARRLRAVGMRPISLAVDITNYVLLELGHPLHAFDYHLVKDGHIVVREAAKGESIVTLDGKTRKLSEGTVLICDAEKPVAIGGIMGGDNSEINDNTVDILLESAYFAPDYIRRSLRHLGMFSEASQRFERGADPNNVMKAMNRACQLFAELAGGQVAAGVVDAYPVEIRPKHITLDPDYVNRLLGTTLSQAEMVALLGKLNIPVANGEVIVPTYRPDMEQEADVAEEVARMLGYDNIPLKVVSPLPYSNNFDPFDDFLEAIRQSLSGIGIQEIVTNSMINKESWGEITGAEIYPIMNPISGDMNGMRNSLVPSFLTALRWNVNRQVRDLKMFEIGRTFGHPGDLKKMPEERLQLAVAMTGRRRPEAWHSSSELVDFYDIKGVVEFLLGKFPLDKIRFIDYDDFAVAGQVLAVMNGEQRIGFFGQIRPDLQSRFDLENPVYTAVLDLRAIFESMSAQRLYAEIPRYPAVDRDFAILVSRETPAAEIVALVEQHGGPFLKSVNIFDVYSGKQVEASQKSVAFRMVFRSPEKTLTEGEVNQATARVLKVLEKELCARLRS